MSRWYPLHPISRATQFIEAIKLKCAVYNDDDDDDNDNDDDDDMHSLSTVCTVFNYNRRNIINNLLVKPNLLNNKPFIMRTSR